ncbi:MAG: AAA family ATPase, partial [Calditrichota bacterium]
ITAQDAQTAEGYKEEVAALLFCDNYDDKAVQKVSVREELDGFLGDHPAVSGKHYSLDYHEFSRKLERFSQVDVPLFRRFVELKKDRIEAFREELRLEEFKPRVLTSFVRNKLIDQLYLPIIGDNLAKQMGEAGAATRTDRMGMLLLISPPGYGKTTLMEYVANRLGIIFMKINGPAIGHQVTSLDPQEAPNAAAREEVEKLNLALEFGDNIMIYLDDIQHCNPEFLQKFISLCDAQRKIEGVYKGRSRTYDLRGRKVCVVMAGNPYTESGEAFKIPDMLANRADTYNLGDILGDNAEIFKLSYLENSLTSNSILSKLANKEQQDLYSLIRFAETGDREQLKLAANYSAEEVKDYVAVIQRLLRVRDVILTVNQEYIRSAGQADAYRTEPPFKLQGSYRNMNKLAEKVLPVMNKQELETLIFSHYEQEAQTLTTGAEANILKFRELNDLLSKEDAARWEDIKK